MKKIDQIRWSNFSKREKILVALTVGSIFYAILLFFYFPQRSQWKRLHAQKSSVEQEVSALSSALPEMMRKADGSGAALPLMVSIPFPVSDSALSAILEEVNQTAR